MLIEDAINETRVPRLINIFVKHKNQLLYVFLNNINIFYTLYLLLLLPTVNIQHIT